MITILIASMILSGLTKALFEMKNSIGVICGGLAITLGLWFVYEFGSLVIMCLEKYAGLQ